MLKFAVVREDVNVEASLLRKFGVRSALVVGSGGCTALTLASQFPELDIACFDVNPAQLAHIEAKRIAALAGERAQLNVGSDSPTGLNQCGEFEGLFRQLRHFFVEFIASPESISEFFNPTTTAHRRSELAHAWQQARYWRAAFATTFDETFLVAMFGPAAIQHAAPGSYPAYFAAAFARGLSHVDAHHNPFLQHVLLGCYLAADAPTYITQPPQRAPRYVLGGLTDLADLASYGLYSLSNIFDWSDDAMVSSWAQTLSDTCAPGSVVLIRQLNNTRSLRPFFAPAFRFDDGLGQTLWEADRSLFYNRIEVGIRI